MAPLHRWPPLHCGLNNNISRRTSPFGDKGGIEVWSYLRVGSMERVEMIRDILQDLLDGSRKWEVLRILKKLKNQQ